MPPRQPRRYLPHGFEEKRTPDGRTYWINYRPLPPSWLPPADVMADFPNLYVAEDADSAADVKTSGSFKEIILPKGVQRHYTPSGTVYYVDARPRASWVDPRTVDFSIDKERDTYAQTCEVLFTHGEFLEPPPETHIEFRLLSDLTKWRVAQSLSGYPDARVDEVDIIINMLNARIGSVPNIHQLKPMDGAFIRACYKHISSEAEMSSYGPSKAARAVPPSASIAWRLFEIFAYCLLLGVPATYARRLQKADWVQWSSRHRWTDQQRALDGFLKSLTGEWNLINLTAALLLSAAVGMLTVNDLSTISQTAILIALVTALASLIMSVTFVWRYQRQLSNIHDLRKIMDEFIYEADADIMPIFLSLPVSFLLWSAIAFGTAVLAHAWNTIGTSGPAIPVGVTATLCLTILVTGVIWLSHRHFERWKVWWSLTAWSRKSEALEEHEVGLMRA
ncbi:HlyD domain-containing protein [Ceratobasidium sp. AG-Ba]|nr:HlyD domain-containing protein [Ceratobasidium sp. AG-Ba]QRW15277.1 HlyD domain-containing protein [Ceratobasidium sp. AG-Ba]